MDPLEWIQRSLATGSCTPSVNLKTDFPNLKYAIIGYNIASGKTAYLFSQDFTVFGKSKTL